MTPYPIGTITFLFTDIEGSTQLWERHPEEMGPALARHDTIVLDAVGRNEGRIIKSTGDGVMAAFRTAPEAIAAALFAQSRLLAEAWPEPIAVSVRMGVHTGAAQFRDGDYFGPALNRGSRLMACGHGGQILLSEATQELCRDSLPPDASLKSLGEFRMRDLMRPETIYQLRHPALPTTLPPLRTLDNPNVPNNLPQQPTRFIGREQELAEIKLLLAKTHLLTLTGAGGSGKTRLSLQAAADLLDTQSDGVWVIELASLYDRDLIGQTVARTLGIREQSGQPITRTLLEALRSRRMLLLLDNCEHLIAGVASLAADLLRHCPGIRILATSREALNVTGEQIYRVPSLSLPGPGSAQTAEALSQYEAVRLFIERAQAAQPTFTVTNTNAPAVARICIRLDGIPLAIELAAARVRSLSVEDINARLSQRFRLLVGGSRAALPRQQTLRALIDWSYDLLTEPERALLLRVAVFAGGWELESAEDICSGDPVEKWEVLDLLTVLADKSLVAAESVAGSTRYRLLETVRQYAGDRLSERRDAETQHDRHLDWCIARAEDGYIGVQGAEQPTWLTCLEIEHDNLRAGLTWAAASPARWERELQLAGALGLFWYVRGHWAEGRAHLTSALNHVSARLTREAARAIDALGRVLLRQGDLANAHALAEEALEINRQLGDRNGEANALNRLAGLMSTRGDYKSARQLCDQAVAIYRATQDLRGEALVLGSLGHIESSLGQMTAASAHFERALVIYRRIGCRGDEAFILNNLGETQYILGDLHEARAAYQQALEIHRTLGDRNGESNSLANLGDLHASSADWAQARPLYECSLAIKRQIGARSDEANILDKLSRVVREQAELAEARTLLLQSLAIRKRLRTPGTTQSTLEECAALALAENLPRRAVLLCGAAQADRDAASVLLLPIQKTVHEHTLSAARATLGDVAFTTAWDEGQAMTSGHAVDYAASGATRELMNLSEEVAP